MNIERVFKITTTDCRSCATVFRYFLPELIITYSTQYFSLPVVKDSAIFVFKDLSAAEMFISTNRRYRDKWVVWEAEALNVRQKKMRLRVGMNFAKQFLDFWLRGKFGQNRASHRYYVCDALRLIKIVL